MPTEDTAPPDDTARLRHMRDATEQALNFVAGIKLPTPMHSAGRDLSDGIPSDYLPALNASRA